MEEVSLPSCSSFLLKQACQIQSQNRKLVVLCTLHWPLRKLPFQLSFSLLIWDYRRRDLIVKTLPTGKPYPLNCFDHSEFFSPVQTICTCCLFLGWLWGEKPSELSRVDGRWNSCSERQLLFCVCVCLVCGWLLLSTTSERLKVLCLCLQPSVIACYCACATEQSARTAHTKSACCRMFCEDGEDMFTSKRSKCYPNLAFGQQWTLLKMGGISWIRSKKPNWKNLVSWFHVVVPAWSKMPFQRLFKKERKFLSVSPWNQTLKF